MIFFVSLRLSYKAVMCLIHRDFQNIRSRSCLDKKYSLTEIKIVMRCQKHYYWEQERNLKICFVKSYESGWSRLGKAVGGSICELLLRRSTFLTCPLSWHHFDPASSECAHFTWQIVHSSRARKNVSSWSDSLESLALKFSSRESSTGNLDKMYPLEILQSFLCFMPKRGLLHPTWSPEGLAWMMMEHSATFRIRTASEVKQCSPNLAHFFREPVSDCFREPFASVTSARRCFLLFLHLNFSLFLNSKAKVGRNL